MLPSEAVSSKRLGGKVDVDDVFGDDARAEVGRLLPHQFHQFRPADALLVVRGHELPPLLGQRTGEIFRQIAAGKAGIVLHLGRQGQLAQGQGAGQAVFFGDGALEHERLQGGSGRIDGGRPRGGAAADDDDFFGHEMTFGKAVNGRAFTRSYAGGLDVHRERFARIVHRRAVPP